MSQNGMVLNAERVEMKMSGSEEDLQTAYDALEPLNEVQDIWISGGELFVVVHTADLNQFKDEHLKPHGEFVRLEVYA